ncbi:unnamed protein product [Caenorhabditis brenneri]
MTKLLFLTLFFFVVSVSAQVAGPKDCDAIEIDICSGRKCSRKLPIPKLRLLKPDECKCDFTKCSAGEKCVVNEACVYGLCTRLARCQSTTG